MRRRQPNARGDDLGHLDERAHSLLHTRSARCRACHEGHAALRGALEAARQTLPRDLAHAASEEPELKGGELDLVTHDRGAPAEHRLVDSRARARSLELGRIIGSAEGIARLQGVVVGSEAARVHDVFGGRRATSPTSAIDRLLVCAFNKLAIGTRHPRERIVAGRVRILVAKPGLDGHDRGIKIVARALRDAGMEVIYTGLHQTPDQIAAAAIQEDVDAVGLSCLSGAHMTLFPRVVQLLAEQGAEEILVFGGGIIPDSDVPKLKDAGIAEIFTPGTPTGAIVEWVREHVPEAARNGDSAHSS